MGKPFLPDPMLYIAAGINPKTGAPTRLPSTSNIKEQVRKVIRIMDEQEATNRYTWYNLPSGINGQLLERILYYRGQAILFYFKEMDKFYFLPYALDGTIDPYGRFETVTPLPFLGGTADDKDGKPKAWIQGLKRTPVYSLEDVIDDPSKFTVDNCCIILKDYTPQMNETIIARQILQEPFIDMMAEAFPMARTNLIANSGIKGLRVPDEDSKKNAEDANLMVQRAALSGAPFVPIMGMQEFQELSNTGASRVQDFLMYMQSVDNFRRSAYGLKSGGVFEKKAHELQAEAMVNQSNTDLIYNDGLKNRQEFCDMVNLIFGLQIWCEASETAMGIDANMNGDTVDDEEPYTAMEGGVSDEDTEV